MIIFDAHLDLAWKALDWNRNLQLPCAETPPRTNLHLTLPMVGAQGQDRFWRPERRLQQPISAVVPQVAGTQTIGMSECTSMPAACGLRMVMTGICSRDGITFRLGLSVSQNACVGS